MVLLVASLGPWMGGGVQEGVAWVFTSQPSVKPTGHVCLMHLSSYYILN